MPSPSTAYATDYSKPSGPGKQFTTKWKMVFASKLKALEIESPNTRELMTKSQRAILKIHAFLASNCPLGQGSIYPQSGSNASTQATSHASQPITVHTTHPISYQFTHPHSHQMTHQLDQYPGGSVEYSQGHMPNSSKWSNAPAGWMTGALQQTSTIESMTKNTRKSTQKSIGSSWMPLLLSKIIPYVNNASKH
jgi:hypothetical protein